MTAIQCILIRCLVCVLVAFACSLPTKRSFGDAPLVIIFVVMGQAAFNSDGMAGSEHVWYLGSDNDESPASSEKSAATHSTSPLSTSQHAVSL